MGGRGSYSSRRRLIGGAGGILILGEGGESSPKMNLAGMNRKIAEGVNPQKTLDYLEKTYKAGMTKEQLQVLDEDGWTVLAKQGTRHSVGFTREEAEFMRGKVVTHNHPNGYGGTLSDADVFNALKYGQKEIRASAAEGVYSLKRTSRSNPRGFANALMSSQGKLNARMLNTIRRFDNGKNSDMVVRKLWVDVLHRWYARNAPKYGYEYKFTPNAGYNIRKAKEVK